MLPVYFISQRTLETWDYDTPFSTGVGGSETAHIECAIRLAKRGYEVISYCPLPTYKVGRIHEGVRWLDVDKEPFPKEPCIILNYRCPKIFDRPKPKGQSWWFIAQDCDYDNQWTEQAIKNTNRFMALCKTHSDFTNDRYPGFRGKVFITSNGIRTDYIQKLPPLERHPHRMFWASSPDRGLLLLLENWFRIRERFPNAELRIAYGFNNMDTIIRCQGPQSPLIPLRNQLFELRNQPGLTWLGRLTQDKVFEEWQQASVLPYCSDWPETSPLHGDSLIETPSGRFTIQSLVGKEFLVYSCSPTGELSLSKAKNVKCTRRNEPVIKLTYTYRGNHCLKTDTLTLTPDHEVMLRYGSYIPAGELKIGDSIKAFHRQENGWGAGYDMIGITDQERIPEHRFVWETYNNEKLSGRIVDHVDENKRNNLPDNLEAKTQARHASDHYYRLTPKKQALKAELLRTINKNMTIEERTKRANKAWKTRRAVCGNHKIIKIEDAGTANVYCMEVEPDHNFVTNGLIVHNCITIMEAMACGAIPVTTNYWAQGEHAGAAPLSYVVDGLPQKSDLVKCLWLEMLYDALELGEDDSDTYPPSRDALIKWARKRYDWERIIDQWEVWLQEDMNPPTKPKKIVKRKK